MLLTVLKTGTTIKAEIMLEGYETTESVTLSLFTAKIKATMKEERSRELVRCMKKPLPTELEYSLIYVSHLDHWYLQNRLIGAAKTGREHDQSRGSRSQEKRPDGHASVLQGLCIGPNK